MKPGLTPADVLLLLTLAAGLGWLYARVWSPPTPALAVQVNSPAGSRQIPLDQPQTLVFSGPLGTTRLEIAERGVRFVDSPCRHQVCVRSGWHQRSGAVAACVPNRISLVLVGGGGDLDALSY